MCYYGVCNPCAMRQACFNVVTHIVDHFLKTKNTFVFFNSFKQFFDLYFIWVIAIYWGPQLSEKAWCSTDENS